MARKFWFVWNPNGHPPSYKHFSLQSAEEEAERLARMNPGERFIVLESVAHCERREVFWEGHLEDDDSDLPF